MALEQLGPYRLEKTLGRGGMGAVYLGIHRETGEKAAVKVLAPNLSDDLLFRERFKAEVNTLKQLLHPGIVRLHGYGEEDGHLYYVMEYVPGRNLQDELAAGRRFTWRDVTRMGVQIALALKHAHDRGVVHRDLKPANLLLTDDDQVKLTDFGIAKLYGGTSVTADGSVMGTADYMAPEQARGKQVTSRCDLYSLGSVLYALITGRPPFAGKTLTEVIHNLMHEKPVALRRLAPDAPDELENIVMQLLEKDAANRIPTAIAVANRLKAMEHALSIETRIEPPTPAVDDDDFALQPLDQPTPRSHPTSRGLNSSPTVDMPASGPHSALVGGELPTLITGPNPSPLAGLPTQATSQNAVQPSAATHAPSGNEYALAPPVKSSHFTTVSEEELRRKYESREAPQQSKLDWAKLAGVLLSGLVALALFAFAMTRQPSADHLATTIQAAVDADGTEGLIVVEADLENFIERFPDDPRAGQMQAYAKELDLYRLQRQFDRRTRRSADGQALLPVERLYLQAQRTAQTDPVAALEQFEAIVTLLAGDRDPKATKADELIATRCLDLAKKQIEQLKETGLQTEKHQLELIRRQLDRATELATDKPAEAAAIRQSVITLFGDKPWAAEMVREAQSSASATAP
ncbi:Serine/threonine-protein kinase StkP [Anatilimnocola aggregata]|uniref:non-specific serine/threonine protein kinase n=1 Tax=Anatilimnocola aggregata TaxID=2528021 RepID=A0A517YIC9_9BACT|nr:serine/threonine-protein kinase [Anatilimnocola aggregata]QDU29990.1 Serine/threonine-protein kinase StkP [Anatilimnocola aggregata]